MTSIKLGWGTKITLLYLGFVAIILTLVVGSMRQNFDLVSKDYYSEELKYQEIIDASRNQAKLSAPVSLQQVGEQITIIFPEEFHQSMLKGTAQFYSQVDAAWDKSYDLNIQKGKSQISAASLHATTYLVKLHWIEDEKEYYQQTPIIIRK